MNSNKDITDKPDIPKIIGIVGSSAPKLLFRFLPLLMKFKQQAKKGAHIFQKELLNHGVDVETAERLTTIHLEGSDLLGMFKLFQ